ncbi:MAG: tetratricopeptide repeat protein [Bacteroidales bacterium]|nr:tetratricopeptide repeat protein [Bacteroidales bacterium]
MMGKVVKYLGLFGILISSILIGQQSDTVFNFSNSGAEDVMINNKYGRDTTYRREKADAYLKLAEQEYERHKPAYALRYFLSSIFELEILGDSLAIADLKVRIGNIFRESKLYDKSLEYLLAAEIIYLKEQVIDRQLSLLEIIADVYYRQENFMKSLEYYKRLETAYQKEKNDSLLVNDYFNQIRCYNKLELPDTALEYHLRILAVYKSEKDIKNEIITLNNIGFTYKKMDNPEMAIQYFKESLKMEEEITGKENPLTLANLAIVYQNKGDESLALDYLNRASKIVEQSGDRETAAGFYHLSSLVYFNLKDFHNALVYNTESLRLAKEINDPEIKKNGYLLSYEIHEAIYNFEKAISDYQLYLKIKDSLRSERNKTEQALTESAFLADRVSREADKLWASEEMSYLELQRLKLDSANRQQEMEILYKTDSIQKITIEKQQLEYQRAQQTLLLKEEQVYAAKKAKEVDSLSQIEKIQSLELETQKLVQKEQEAQIEVLDRENQIKELSLKKIKARNRFLFGFGILALIIIYLVYRGLRYAKRTNKILVKQKNEIERQKDEIDYERQRSDKLLLNILPEETAEELKEKGSATPRQYELVSVLFTDFKGFTNIAEKLTPQELVEELNLCFLEFDKIIDKYNLEKIKTIGDAYMCAGGIPVENTTNPIDIVSAGLEIRDYMERLKKEKDANGEQYWELRIGIHTGPVVAGVVGKNKFAYDIWGDAVNTASRMESSGLPGKVNISGDTFNLVKEKFKCTHRGKIAAKNKGEIDMYIVEGEK